MTKDIDIFREALRLINERGADAWVFALSKYAHLKANGDTTGAAEWRRIADEIARIRKIDSDKAPH